MHNSSELKTNHKANKASLFKQGAASYYIIRHLQHQHPDLAIQVIQGQMSVYFASIEAGIRDQLLTVPLEDTDCFLWKKLKNCLASESGLQDKPNIEKPPTEQELSRLFPLQQQSKISSGEEREEKKALITVKPYGKSEKKQPEPAPKNRRSVGRAIELFARQLLNR